MHFHSEAHSSVPNAHFFDHLAGLEIEEARTTLINLMTSSLNAWMVLETCCLSLFIAGADAQIDILSGSRAELQIMELPHCPDIIAGEWLEKGSRSQQ
jgi:hypothetical protein